MLPCGMIDDGVNVVEMGFPAAWNQVREIVKRYILPVECLKCEYQPICPSCVAVAVDGNGNPGTCNKDLCIRTKAYAQEMLRSM